MLRILSIFSILLMIQPASAHTALTKWALGRKYTVYAPPNYGNANRPNPVKLVFAFHPHLSNHALFASLTQLHNTNGIEDVAIIYPNGNMIANPSGNQRSWDSSPFCCTPASVQDDVDYFNEMLAKIPTFIDTAITSKVGIVGHSAGAMMVYRLICDESSKIGAAVPYGAYQLNEIILNQDPQSNNYCAWTNTVPILHLHGKSDPVFNPNVNQTNVFNSGQDAKKLDKYMLDQVAVRNSGVVANPTINLYINNYSADMSKFWYSEYNPNTTSIKIKDLGHGWPGNPNPDPNYGPARTDINGSQFIMDTIVGIL